MNICRFRKIVVLMGLLVVAGCSTFHRSSEFDMTERLSSSDEAVFRLIAETKLYSQKQVWLSYENKAGRTISGSGVPLTPTLIATAAHVVNDMANDQQLTVKYYPNMAQKGYRLTAKLKYISEEEDLAVVELVNVSLPSAAIPDRCERSTGGDIITGGQQQFLNEQTAGISYFNGVISNKSTLPPVTAQYNEKAKVAGFPPIEMKGHEKIISLVSSSAHGGNSGGAIFNVETQCVVGVVSMVASVKDFINPEAFIRESGYPQEGYYKNRQVLIGVPIHLFSELLHE